MADLSVFAPANDTRRTYWFAPAKGGKKTTKTNIRSMEGLCICRIKSFCKKEKV